MCKHWVSTYTGGKQHNENSAMLFRWGSPITWTPFKSTFKSTLYDSCLNQCIRMNSVASEVVMFTRLDWGLGEGALNGVSDGVWFL